MLDDLITITVVLAVVAYLWVIVPVRWFRHGSKGHFPVPWM